MPRVWGANIPTDADLPSRADERQRVTIHNKDNNLPTPASEPKAFVKDINELQPIGTQPAAIQHHIATPHLETPTAEAKGLVGNIKSFVGDKWHSLTHSEPHVEQREAEFRNVGPVTPSPVIGAERAWRAGLRPARGDPDMAVASDEEEALAERSDQFVKDAPLGLQEIANAEEAQWLHEHGARVAPILSRNSLHWPGQSGHHGLSFEDRHRVTEWNTERDRALWEKEKRQLDEREARIKPEGSRWVDDIVAPVYRLSYPQEMDHIPLRERIRGHELQARRLERERLEKLDKAPEGATVVEEIHAGAPIRRLAVADDHLTWRERWLGPRVQQEQAPLDAPVLTALPGVDDIVAGAPVARKHSEGLWHHKREEVNPALLDQPALPRGAVLTRANDATMQVVKDRPLEGTPEPTQQGFLHWPSFLGGHKSDQTTKVNVEKDAQWAREQAERAHDLRLKKIDEDAARLKRDTAHQSIARQNEAAKDAHHVLEDAKKMGHRVEEESNGVLSGMKHFVSDKWDAFTHHANEAPHLQADKSIVDRTTDKLDEKSAEAQRKSFKHSIFGEGKRAQLREKEANAAAKTSSVLKSVQTEHTGHIYPVGAHDVPKKGWFSGLQDIPDDEISLMTL